jgi:cyclic beta-1,2-glucan synthetase
MELLLNPCIPEAWVGFEIVYKFQSTVYQISVENPARTGGGVAQATLDGQALPQGTACIPLTDDQRLHHVRVILG